MDKELQQLQSLFGSGSIRVEKSGIGKVNAALGAQRMINEFHPDAIISTGCAGGNGDDIKIQDVVVSTELCYHDVYCGTAIDNTTVYGQVQGLPARYQADPYLLRKAKELFTVYSLPFTDDYTAASEGLANKSTANGKPSTVNIKIHPGLIVTGDWFVDTKEKMREIIGHFPEAKAVDMESAAIAQTCYINKVPFISFRVISDIPLRDTDASQYHDFWNTIANNSFQITRAFVESL
jgi:adenosylhomocysteine nucleosidase